MSSLCRIIMYLHISYLLMRSSFDDVVFVFVDYCCCRTIVMCCYENNFMIICKSQSLELANVLQSCLMHFSNFKLSVQLLFQLVPCLFGGVSVRVTKFTVFQICSTNVPHHWRRKALELQRVCVCVWVCVCRCSAFGIAWNDCQCDFISWWHEFTHLSSWSVATEFARTELIIGLKSCSCFGYWNFNRYTM